MDEDVEPLHPSKYSPAYKQSVSPPHASINIHNETTATNNDQNWPGETQTFISATTDMSHFSQENLARFPKERLSRITCDPQFVSTIVITSISYITPIMFLIIPTIRSKNAPCENDDCYSNILTVIIKLISLSIASYWIFWQKNRIIYPRTHWPRVLSLGLLALTTAVYWLFYAVKILDRNMGHDSAIVFAMSQVDTMLYVHVVAILILETRLRSPYSESMFLLEVMRSTDGELRYYNLSKMTVQEAAFMVLEKYYRDFPLNNPAALLTTGTMNRGRRGKNLNDSTTMNNTQANINLSSKDFKVYNVDKNKRGEEPDQKIVDECKKFQANLQAKKKESHSSSVNEKYYDQLEWERHLRKRKCRLEVAAQDAFDHVNRHEGHTSRKSLRKNLFENDRYPSNIMDANEAATVLFPTIARALQKYLRTTRQHLHYSLSNTTHHLSECLQNGVSFRCFIKRYLTARPQLAYPKQVTTNVDADKTEENVEWSVSCRDSLTSNISDETFFQLSSPDFGLNVHVRSYPRIQLTESFPDNRCRFTLKINTTSV